MRRTVPDQRGRRPGGFTLVELLVVILIVILVSAVALPAVLPALTHRQLSEAARILQAEIVSARDRAIRAGQPCGFRLLPDPAFVNPNNPTSNILAYNRIVPLVMPPDYSLGNVSIPFGNGGQNGMMYLNTMGQTPGGGVGVFNPPYPYPSASGATLAYYPQAYPAELMGGLGPFPYPDPWSKLVPTFSGSVLMIVAEPIQGGTGWSPAVSGPSTVPNEPVNWWWNIRVGDQLQINGDGNTYTVVGPIEVRPTNPNTAHQGNPELFVNVGLPGATFGGPGIDSPLLRMYGAPLPTAGAQFPMPCQFLFLVNGDDDDGDGYVDDGWDYVDNDLSLIRDNFLEWEQESWLGTLNPKKRGPTSRALLDMNYTITRRPVPTAGARVTTLPANVVIDATTWNTTAERSRLPIDPFSFYVDIMILPGGQVLPTTRYSNPGSVTMTSSFMHFWLTERLGIVEPAAVTAPLVGNALLPMPAGTANYPSTAPPLQGDRVLITLFTKSGQVVSNSIETFNGLNTNIPFQYAQLGVGEAK